MKVSADQIVTHLRKIQDDERVDFHARGYAEFGADEIERLRRPYRAVDAEDWKYIMDALGDGGRGRFWKAVLIEVRAALILERARD